MKPIIEQKAKVVAEIEEMIKSFQAAILVDYRGLTVAEMTELRRKLKEKGAEIKVVKNTLTKRAVNNLGITGLDPYLEGPTALAVAKEDPAAAAKVLFDFAKDHPNLEIKVGILENIVLEKDKVKAIADLPPRDVLLAKVLGGMQAPLYGFAGALAGVLRKFVYALEAIRKQKAGEE
ncbi:50S ribosomal protein L10 [Carboxydothermus islandicus]|uniref:Large ribosomal subunit protein uL10 n=1 Tax=Carboxydothermus islandicus TaxID=661089 RepID=A0A1L8CZE7_9THEO|nr:50S ribosomal protein L10 [Carboxydothermus islandicus]GAV24244.1 50S ribosomal protein L10 [Carboxydothermus islandicus]